MLEKQALNFEGMVKEKQLDLLVTVEPCKIVVYVAVLVPPVFSS